MTTSHRETWSARGLVELKPDRTLSGRLGPADRIVIRWSRPGPRAASRTVGSVEGLALWDVNPAGDRLRRGSPTISPGKSPRSGWRTTRA